MNRRKFVRIGLVAAVLAFGASLSTAARANSLIIDLGTSHNGSAPSGSPPWLTVDFESKSGGHVVVTMTSNMPSAEITTMLLFNVASNINPANLSFSNLSGPIPTSATGGSTTGDPSIMAGTFNVEFQWTSANNGNQFSGGTTVVETISDLIDHISASSFNAVSTGSQGGFLSAGEVQNIPGSNSGTIVNSVTPEPSSWVLSAIGLVGAIAVARRQRCRSGQPT